MRAFVLVLLLWLPALGDAAPPTIDAPAEVRVKPNRMGLVVIKHTGNWLTIKTCPKDALDAFREWDPDPKVYRLRFILYADPETKKAAPAYLYLTSGNAEGGTEAETLVSTDVGPIPPKPPQPPEPPGPTDQLTTALQAAWQQEPERNAQQLATLGGLYRDTATRATADATLATVGDLFASLKRSFSAALPDTALTRVRAAIATELSKQLPTSPTAPLDAATRERCKTQFERVAKCLGEVK